ncbi:MAG: hypothetical protein IPJ69_11165 [Deltaproteobacteria bacterium]|nr:MAG: hypothetical protein IPJ69_11165 [Deltaproteobacteria bacterium]
MSAELEGVVTKAGTTTPIRTLDDLKNCSVSSGTGGSSAAGTGGSSSNTGGASGSPAATGGTTGSGTGGDSGGAGSLIVGGLKIDRIDPVTEAIIPPAINTSIVFPEVPARGVPDSRLYRLSNVGTSPVTLTNLTVVDTNSNFRLFGPMQGATFATRVFPENPDSLTVPVSGGVGANDIFFFLSYGPQGSFSASTRNDTGILSYRAGSVSAVVSLTGTASNETRGQLALYVRDENRFVVTHQADLVLGTGAAEAHYYLPKSQVFSYRQDGSTDREVYLYNNAAVGSDPVVVQGISLGSHEKFRFDRTGGDLPEGCYLAPVTVMGISTPDSTGLGMRTTACAMNATLNPGQGVKLGKIIFTPGSSTTYQISSITMAVKAPTNISASLMEGRRPRIAGGDAGLGTGTVVNFGLKGVTGAPSGEKGLRINRLIAGFKDFANPEYQSSRNISSMSRGTMSRYVAASPTAMTRSIDDWKDVYTIESSATRGAVSLDPVRGTIRLTRIVSPLDRNASGDLDMNNPTPPSRYRGLRLYNSIGSLTPATNIYYPMCKDGRDPRGVPYSCGFFYLFIGDRAGSTTPLTRAGVPAACMGKKGASAKYLTPNPDAQVLNPLRQAEYDCIKDYNLQDAIGLYDPVTGEITLRDLIVRLNAPNNPRIDVPIDTTMNLSLSTSCVSSDLVPDEEARSSGINVPQDVLNDVGVDPFIARSSTWPTPVPISTYVGNTHNSGCSNGMLHGRPLFMTADPTDTLDNAGDPMPAVIPNTFDLAGVGHLTGNNDNLTSTNLYIVIKAEIGETCPTSHRFVPNLSMCGMGE